MQEAQKGLRGGDERKRVDLVKESIDSSTFIHFCGTDLKKISKFYLLDMIFI
jgi:hypothetical protein